MKNKRIVVTGMAPITSRGEDIQSFWSSLMSCEQNVEKENFVLNEEISESYYLYKLKNFNIRNIGLESRVLDEIKDWKNGGEVDDLNYLLAGAKLALDDAKLNCFKATEIGLILTHENPGLNQFIKNLTDYSYELLTNRNITRADYFKRIYEKFSKSVYDLQTFMFPFLVGRALGIKGASYYLNNACASGLYALELAKMLIQSRQCSSVVVAASDKPDIYKYLWFKNNGFYTKEKKMNPFSNLASGFLFGDGAAGVVLESLESANKRRVEIYAEYIGGAFSSEGWKVAFPAVKDKYYSDTILKSLKICGVNKNKVDLVVPHGVAMKVTDIYESQGLSRVFKENKTVKYSTFKPYVGHNLGASALLESIILILSIKNQIVPATLNQLPANEKINIDFVQEHTKMKINYALKTTSAFAGYNASVIFKRFNQ